MIVGGFKQCLKEGGRSIKWFYDTKVKGNVDIGYSGFTAQLNGYTSDLSPEIKALLVKFMEETDGEKIH